MPTPLPRASYRFMTRADFKLEDPIVDPRVRGVQQQLDGKSHGVEGNFNTCGDSNSRSTGSFASLEP